MQDLIEQQGPAYSVNLYVFYALQRSITGWPGGKPDRGAVSFFGPLSPPALSEDLPFLRCLSSCFVVSAHSKGLIAQPEVTCSQACLHRLSHTVTGCRGVNVELIAVSTHRC